MDGKKEKKKNTTILLLSTMNGIKEPPPRRQQQKRVAVFYLNRKRYRADRLAYIWFVGNLKRGLSIQSTCGTEFCINPLHHNPCPKITKMNLTKLRDERRIRVMTRAMDSMPSRRNIDYSPAHTVLYYLSSPNSVYGHEKIPDNFAARARYPLSLRSRIKDCQTENTSSLMEEYNSIQLWVTDRKDLCLARLETPFSSSASYSPPRNNLSLFLIDLFSLNKKDE